MDIYIGSDHAGFELKEDLKAYLREKGYKVFDKGAFNYDENDDYPDFISAVAREVSENINSKGVILGGSGQGEAIVANRFKDIRAIVYYGGNEDILRLSREHNDANIISFGARFIKKEDAKKALDIWLQTDFSQGERHKRRIEKLKTINQRL